nr:hypothetical protein [Desulfobacterales bacterium]
MKSFKPIELDKLRTYSLKGRTSKVNHHDFSRPWRPGGAFNEFIERLPRILAAKDFSLIVSDIVRAYQERKTVALAMGAHVIKVGLTPVVIDLMEQKVITAIAMNGAGIIHDTEIALIGQTSEDVEKGLDHGEFGMAKETAAFLNEAIRKAGNDRTGLGRAIGQNIIERELPFQQNSILAAGARLDIPVTVHVAIGTDIIHMHPGFDPYLTGAATHRDFRIFSSVVASLEGGVYLNVGSAVVLPEVFLKALTLVRNMGHEVYRFTAVNMDFIRHYRPITNVVDRPTVRGGKGYNITGHHEIMFPLLAAAVIEEINRLNEK